MSEPQPQLKSHLRRPWTWITFVGLALLDQFVHPHAPFAWAENAGFFAWFGFLSCVAMIIGAKIILGPVLKREENYYDR